MRKIRPLKSSYSSLNGLLFDQSPNSSARFSQLEFKSGSQLNLSQVVGDLVFQTDSHPLQRNENYKIEDYKFNDDNSLLFFITTQDTSSINVKTFSMIGGSDEKETIDQQMQGIPMEILKQQIKKYTQFIKLTIVNFKNMAVTYHQVPLKYSEESKLSVNLQYSQILVYQKNGSGILCTYEDGKLKYDCSLHFEEEFDFIHIIDSSTLLLQSFQKRGGEYHTILKTLKLEKKSDAYDMVELQTKTLDDKYYYNISLKCFQRCFKSNSLMAHCDSLELIPITFENNYLFNEFGTNVINIDLKGSLLTVTRPFESKSLVKSFHSYTVYKFSDDFQCHKLYEFNNYEFKRLICDENHFQILNQQQFGPLDEVIMCQKNSKPMMLQIEHNSQFMKDDPECARTYLEQNLIVYIVKKKVLMMKFSINMENKIVEMYNIDAYQKNQILAFDKYDRFIMDKHITLEMCEQMKKKIPQGYQLVSNNRNLYFLFKNKIQYLIYDYWQDQMVTIDDDRDLEHLLIGDKDPDDYYLIYNLKKNCTQEVLIDRGGNIIMKKDYSVNNKEIFKDYKRFYFYDYQQTIIVVKKTSLQFYDILKGEVIKNYDFDRFEIIQFADARMLLVAFDRKEIQMYDVENSEMTLLKSKPMFSFDQQYFRCFDFSFYINDYLYFSRNRVVVIVNKETLEYVGQICILGDSFSQLDYFSQILYLNNSSVDLPKNQYMINEILNYHQYGFKMVRVNFDEGKENGVEILDFYKQRLAQVNFRFKFADNLKIFYYIDQISKEKFIQNQIKLLKELTLTEMLQIIPSKHYYTFLHFIVQQNPMLLPEITKLLVKSRKIEDLLIFTRDQNNITPFDIAIKQNNSSVIKVLLSWMLEFQNHPLFNYVIDKHFTMLITNKYEIKEYLESQLPIFKIKHLNNNYKELSTDQQTLLLGVNDDLFELVDNYPIVGQHLSEDDNNPKVNIEYWVINLPQTLTGNSKNFIKYLSRCNDLKIFETLIIQTIINFKWHKYTKQFYMYQLLFFIAFLIAFLIDLYFYVIIGNDRSIVEMIILKSICCICLLIEFQYEVFQLQKQKGGYFKDYWNFLDFLNIVVYPVMVVIDFLGVSQTFMIISQCLFIFTLFFKLCFYLRIFDNYSFLVSMIFEVFKDLKYFLLFYTFVIMLFGFMFTLLLDSDDSEITSYEGVDYFGYFIMAFRASTGDFQIDNFYQLDNSLIIFTWIIWIICVIFLNIILLNFIIAVISQSYDKTMQSLQAKIYKMKAQMIKEREAFFNDSQRKNPEYFPRYIILRRPVEEGDGEGHEWQGFVREIKNSIHDSKKKQDKAMAYQHDQLMSEIQEISTKIEKENKEIKSSQQQLEQQLKTIQDGFQSQDKKISEMFNIIAKTFGPLQKDKRL